MAPGDARNRKKGSAKQRKQSNNNKKGGGRADPAAGAAPPPSSSGRAARGGGGGNNAAAASAEEDQTLWQVFRSHPVVVAAPYLLVPVALYYAYLFVALRRPDLAGTATAGLVELRPAVREGDVRQVLIVGSLGGGTIQVADALRKVLKLEVLHEGADAEASFARDGTASSLLGWRYAGDLSPPRLSQALHDLCLNRTDKDTQQVFQPSMFVPTKCSSWVSLAGGGWTQCHAKECVAYVGREYGCALRNGGAGGGGSPPCRPRFARVLHQARHPLRTIPELVSGACPSYAAGGEDNATVHPTFVQFATAFLDRDGDARSGSCLASVSWYVVRYNRALLAARRKGLISSMYRYEDSTACDVARLGGFADPGAVVYRPNLAKVEARCGSNAAAPSDPHKPLPSLAPGAGKGRKHPELAWADYERAGGSKLVRALRDLCKDMGYDPDAASEGSAKAGKTK